LVGIYVGIHEGQIVRIHEGKTVGLNDRQKDGKFL
jgi:Tfp pilus assembly protein PilP